jgi:ureidoglycolate hydrolase
MDARNTKSANTFFVLLMIRIEPLTRKAFAPYGDVVAAEEETGSSANQGTATRFNHLTRLVNKRTHGAFLMDYELTHPPATENVCIFRVKPATIPFHIKLLERHKYSTQMFIPMTHQNASYLVIVCLNDPATNRPDMKTLRAFRATSMQAFNYKPGTWHHPMIGLKSIIDFVCVVYERRQHQTEDGEDTEEIFFPEKKLLAVEPSKL